MSVGVIRTWLWVLALTMTVVAATTSADAVVYGYDGPAGTHAVAHEGVGSGTGSSLVLSAPEEVAVPPRAAVAGAVTTPGLHFVAPQTGLNSSNALSGVDRASPQLLDAVGQRRTVQYATPGSDDLRYLDSIGAEANVGGANVDHILLRPNPSKAAVLEEFLHGTQQRLGVIDRLGVPGAERHVKDFMIRHQRMLGLSPEDVRRLQALMEAGL